MLIHCMYCIKINGITSSWAYTSDCPQNTLSTLLFLWVWTSFIYVFSFMVHKVYYIVETKCSICIMKHNYRAHLKHCTIIFMMLSARSYSRIYILMGHKLCAMCTIILIRIGHLLRDVFV